MWDTPGELTVVRAVHEALRGRFRDIADIYQERPKLMEKKFADESSKWGRAFSGAMTADQFRKILCDLFRRAGQNPELQRRWQQLLPMLRTGTWQHARDLALIGICSYQPRVGADVKTNTDQDT
jgi:CRISPR-associated protein Cas8a1/Csx13